MVSEGLQQSVASKATNPMLGTDAKRVSLSDEAVRWFHFGYDVLPIVAGEKRPTVKRNEWLSNLSIQKVQDHWNRHPQDELGFILGAQHLVLDGDTPEAIAAMRALEAAFGVQPTLVVKTRRGEHHHLTLAPNVFAKTDTRRAEDSAARIDVIAANGQIILPPSTGKSIGVEVANHSGDLTQVDQGFVDAVFRHNGVEPPRPLDSPSDARRERTPSGRNLACAEALVNALDPDMGYSEWTTVGMILHHESEGGEDGFVIYNTWSKKGSKYESEQAIRSKWRSFKSDPSKPVTIGTLKRMVEAKGLNWMELCDQAEPQFEVCDTEVVVAPSAMTIAAPTRTGNPFVKFSLRDDVAAIEALAGTKRPLLGDLAQMGEFTVFYAAPNTGKTLLTIFLLCEAIRSGRVDPENVAYINLDDNTGGLAEKLQLANEFGFHMLADGHKGFSVDAFGASMRDMIAGNTAANSVVILDTYKKFVNIMDKAKGTAFNKVLRQFCMMGGTVIALAHTNKNKGQDGKPVQAGTNDLVEDCDCAYILAPVGQTSDSGQRTVVFDNFKRRGNSVQNAGYTYTIENKVSYSELLASVQMVDSETLEPLKRADAMRSDAELVAAIEAGIRAGVLTKMHLAETARAGTGCSKAVAIRIIEKYTGTDPTIHRWTFRVGERGAKVFGLLDGAPA